MFFLDHHVDSRKTNSEVMTRVLCFCIPYSIYWFRNTLTWRVYLKTHKIKIHCPYAVEVASFFFFWIDILPRSRFLKFLFAWKKKKVLNSYGNFIIIIKNVHDRSLDRFLVEKRLDSESGAISFCDDVYLKYFFFLFKHFLRLEIVSSYSRFDRKSRF